MLSKFIILLLGTTVILQGLDAAPYQDMESSVKALRERLTLVQIWATEINDVLVLVLRNCKSLVEKILTAPEVLNIKTDLMEKNLKEMRDFVEKFEEYEKAGILDKDSGIRIVGMFRDIEKKFVSNNELENEEDKVIANFIKEQNFKRLPNSVQVRVQNFVDKFNNEVETYLDGLNEAEKKEEIELVEFIAAMKAETDEMKKGDLIKDLMESFDLLQFVWESPN